MKQLIYLLMLTIISFSSMGKGIDLSGTWNLNKSKSTLNADYSMAPNQLILAQSTDLLTVERHSNWQGQEFTSTDKFTLDGKESINAGWQDTQKKSTAVWSADETVLTIISKIPMQDSGEMTITEIYQIDGGNLKIVSSASSSFGDISETYLFEKP